MLSRREDLLRMSGILDNVRQMAGYVPGEQPKGNTVIKLNTNESPYPPSPRVFEAIAACLTGDKLRKYPEPMGDTFREAAGRILGVRPESILIGNGSDDVLTILTRAFVPRGGLMVSPSPSYILYKSLAEIQGARFKTIPYGPGWSLPDPWPQMADGAQLTFIANPNSPSGTFIEPSKVLALSNAIGPTVLDEAYVDFAEDSGIHLASHNLIVSRTFSKSYALAGIRFGYAVADPALVRELVKVKDSYNCDVLSLAAATAAIEDQAYLKETRRKILGTRERMEFELSRLGFDVTPSQANFVWCRRTDRPVKPLAEGLKSAGILVRYMNYTDYGDGLRISVGTEAEIDRLLETLTGLLKG
jgi:histidinol-phosphate aminotransferase